jgi:hypothetical protein
MSGLRTAQVAHGDLQHGNVIVQNGTLRLVDLDGMFVPSMSQMNASELGHRHYQHPLRDQFLFNRDLDNFSSLVIYVSLISLAERPEFWKRFHDENLILNRSDFLNPSASPAFTEIKKIGGEPKRLAEILEKACRAAPSMTPSLPDLVTPTSKLPAWMVAPAGVVIPTKTREVIPGQALSGASSSTTSSTAGTSAWWQQSQAASQSSPIQQPVQQQYSAASPPQPATTQVDWKQVRSNTVSKAVAFGLTGLFFVWAWFPLLNGIYRDMGFQSDSVGLTIWTYVLGSLAFGFSMAMRSSKGKVTTASPHPSFSSPKPAHSPAPMPYPYASGRSSQRYPSSTPLHPVAVVASRARHIYHRPSCEWARKISARNKISFSSTTDAKAAGYRRCGVCLP